MSNLVFLLAALILSVVGCGVLLLRHRKPTSLEHGISSFDRQMRALAPQRQGAVAPVRDSGSGEAGAPPHGAGPRR